MKPKSRTSKKALAANLQGLQDYVHKWEKIAHQDPWVKRGYELGERMQREAELLQSGNDIPETELPLWVRELYRRLSFLNPRPIPEKPTILGQQAGQALALALFIRDQHRVSLSTGSLTLKARAELETGGWLFHLAEGALLWAQDSSQKEALEFFEGFARGQRQAFDKSGQMLFTDATPLYLILLLHWPEIEKMSSIAELHSYLESLGFLSIQLVGDIARLQKLCHRIGLKLAGRGRPRK